MPLSLVDSIGLNDLTNNGSVVGGSGYAGLAAQFNGANHLTASDSSDFDVYDESFYVDFYLRSTSYSGVQCVICKWGYGPSTARLFSVYFGIVNANCLELRVVDSTGNDVVAASSVDWSTLDTSAFHHVRAGYDKDSQQIYITVNGTTDYTSYAETIGAGGDANPLRIGVDQGTSYVASGTAIDTVSFVKSGSATATWTFGTPANPLVSLEASTSTIDENGGTATVSATLDQVGDLDAIVDLSFSGTATNGVDYSASSTSILIPAGQTSGSITITAIDDVSDEGGETIIVDISSVTNGTENGSQQVTITITDDDGTPVFSIPAIQAAYQRMRAG